MSFIPKEKVLIINNNKIRQRQRVAFHPRPCLNLSSQSFRFGSFLANGKFTQRLTSATYGCFSTLFLESYLQYATAQTDTVMVPLRIKMPAIVDGPGSGLKIIIVGLAAWRSSAVKNFSRFTQFFPIYVVKGMCSEYLRNSQYTYFLGACIFITIRTGCFSICVRTHCYKILFN